MVEQTRSCRNCVHSTHRHDELVCQHPAGDANTSINVHGHGVCSVASRSTIQNALWDARCIERANKCPVYEAEIFERSAP